MGVVAYIRVLTGVLERFARFAKRAGLARGRHEISPDLPWLEGMPADTAWNDVHREIEPALHAAVSAPAGGPVAAFYGYAMKKCVTDYTVRIAEILKLLQWVEENVATPWRLAGGPPHLGRVHRMYFGRAPHYATRASRLPDIVFNLFNALASLAAGIAWLAARTRIGMAAPRRHFLALDTVSLLFEREFLRHALDRPEDALLVYRNAHFARNNEAAELARQYTHCTIDDVRIGPGRALRLAAQLALDLVRLWAARPAVDSPVFGRYCALAVKRAMFAAFFHRFPVRFFFCRDDYSMDHIVRNRVLRDLGGTSIGLIHGIPTNTHVPEWREIDCDIYYVFGRHVYEHYFKSGWPAHMKVRGVGAFRMTPDYHARLAAPRPKDIAYFPIVHRRFDFIMDEVFKIAEHFRDRKVYIKMKWGRSAAEQAQFEALARTAPDNVVIYEDRNAYDLLLRISYALGAGTTVSAEALQFKAASFIFDVDPMLKDFYYRNFPELIVADADDVIRRIEDIEAGREQFDFKRFEGLIAMPDRDFFSLVREDLGLTPPLAPEGTEPERNPDQLVLEK